MRESGGVARSTPKTWIKLGIGSNKRASNPCGPGQPRSLAPAQTVEGTVFYPFSGPDVVNMLAFFPQAKTYLLIALEPVGTLPVFRPGANEPFYSGLEQSLSELLYYNFFFTKRMETNLVKKELDGVLPVLLFFLGRENVQVLDVKYWLMQPDGSITEKPVKGGEKLTGEGIPGVKIVFQRQEGEPEQTLYYFRFNLLNTFWRSHPHFVKFLKGFAPYQTFLKAASYLMFKPKFEDIRQFILDQSQMVLQTDEGIPLRYFDHRKVGSSLLWKIFLSHPAVRQLFSIRYGEHVPEWPECPTPAIWHRLPSPPGFLQLNAGLTKGSVGGGGGQVSRCRFWQWGFSGLVVFGLILLYPVVQVMAVPGLPITLPQGQWQPLVQRQDPELQANLAKSLKQRSLWQCLIAEDKMAVGLVDLSNPQAPRFCPGERQYHDVCRQPAQDRGPVGRLSGV